MYPPPLRDERCPDCRQHTTLDHIIIDTRLKREMLGCKMHCKHAGRGCDWIGEFGAFAAHVERCSHAASATPPVALSESASALEVARVPGAPDAWRPIDISKAVATVPPEIRPRTPLSRPGTARLANSAEKADPPTPSESGRSSPGFSPGGRGGLSLSDARPPADLPPHMSSLFQRMTTPDTDRSDPPRGAFGSARPLTASTTRDGVDRAAKEQAARLLTEDAERKAREADLLSKIEARAQADAALMAKTRDEAARRSRPTTPAAPRVPPDIVGESAEMLAALEAVHRCDALLRDAESRAPADRAELPGQYPSTWDVE